MKSSQKEILQRLADLDDARDKAIATEQQLITEREALRDVDKDDPEYLEKIARWGEIQRDELPACRAAKNDLANQIQRELKKLRGCEVQEDLPFGGAPDIKDTIAYGRHLLATKAGHRAQDEGGDEVEPDDRDQTTIEDHLPPESAARGGRKPAGDPEWFGTDVREIGLPDAQATALWLADFRTLGDVVREGLKAAQTAGGVTPYAASYLEAVIKDLHAGAPLKEAVQRAGTGNVGAAYRPWAPPTPADSKPAEPDKAGRQKPPAAKKKRAKKKTARK